MKSNKFFLILLCSIFIQVCLGQGYPEPQYKTYHPDYKNAIVEKNPGDTSLRGRMIWQEYIVEFRYNEKNELVEYYTERWKAKMESDVAIVRNNRIYVNLNRAKEIEKIEARITNPDGKQIVIGKEKMQEEKNLEEYGRFYFFALEGLEIGSIIEFEHTTQRNPNYSSAQCVYQEDIPIYNFHFTLIAPDNLIFAFNSVGSAPSPIKDSLDTLRNVWTVVDPFIPAAQEEPYSNVDPYKRAIQYKLQENLYNRKKDIVGFTQAAQTVYESTHPGIDKALAKEFQKLSKQLKLDEMEDEMKIKTIEAYLKNEIIFLESVAENEFTDMATILKNKQANSHGMRNLMLNLFEYFGINCQLVLTCDRFETYFDKKFETYGYLNEYLIYFPDLDRFLAPVSILFRYPLIPYSYTETYGMFIKSVKLGEVSTGVPLVKFIPSFPYQVSVDSSVYQVDISDLDNPKLSTFKSLSGYESVYIQHNLHLMNSEQDREIKEVMLKNINDGEELVSSEILNSKKEDVGIRPLIFKGEISYPNLVSSANEDFLIHVGNVIGPQVELYQENERVNDIEMTFNHAYDRTIIMNIPEGYEVKKQEVFKHEYRFEYEGRERMAFVSNYEIQGNQLIIHNQEYYDLIRLDKKYFEDFKSIINAAADFNKMVLILTKK